MHTCIPFPLTLPARMHACMYPFLTDPACMYACMHACMLVWPSYCVPAPSPVCLPACLPGPPTVHPPPHLYLPRSRPPPLPLPSFPCRSSVAHCTLLLKCGSPHICCCRGMVVAAKVLRQHQDGRHAMRCAWELAVTQSLSHPNVVMVSHAHGCWQALRASVILMWSW